jgi:hypothetical protein
LLQLIVQDTYSIKVWQFSVSETEIVDDTFSVKLIRYQFWCTRCAFRLLNTRTEKNWNPKTNCENYKSRKNQILFQCNETKVFLLLKKKFCFSTSILITLGWHHCRWRTGDLDLCLALATFRGDGFCVPFVILGLCFRDIQKILHISLWISQIDIK